VLLAVAMALLHRDSPWGAVWSDDSQIEEKNMRGSFRKFEKRVIMTEAYLIE
jgi:hypothetical protein